MPSLLLILVFRKSWFMTLLTEKFFLLEIVDGTMSFVFFFRSSLGHAKASYTPIPNGDGGSRIEEVHIRTVARAVTANPRLRDFFPQKPQPPKSQGSRKFSRPIIQNSKIR
jgi:hypothetical protein